MIKRKTIITPSEKEAHFLEKRASLHARRDAIRASDDMQAEDSSQLLAEIAVVLSELYTEIDQWKNMAAMKEAQDRATAAGIYAEFVVAVDEL